MMKTHSVAGKRRNYGAEFKAKVALEAIRGDLTVAELMAKHGVHQTLINTWKRQVREGLAGIFSGKVEAKPAEKKGGIESEPVRATGPSGQANEREDRPVRGARFFSERRAGEGAIGPSPLASGR